MKALAALSFVVGMAPAFAADVPVAGPTEEKAVMQKGVREPDFWKDFAGKSPEYQQEFLSMLMSHRDAETNGYLLYTKAYVLSLDRVKACQLISAMNMRDYMIQNLVAMDPSEAMEALEKIQGKVETGKSSQ